MARRLPYLLVLLLALPGCRAADLSRSSVGSDASVSVVEVAPGPGMDAGAQPSMVTILSPSDGARFTQSDVVGGEWAATVDFEVDASGVARTELVADTDFPLGEVDADGRLTYAFLGEGAIEVAAIGYGSDGAELARDTITIHIDPPGDTSCHATLDGLGIDWSVASPSPGIADPVRVEPLINGVSFRYVSNDTPTAMTMDCELAIRLHQLTEIIKPYGLDEVIHIGVYNYRCIGGGDPDSGTCTPSQHAYARAIDLHAFGLADSDATYSTETDFVITTRADPCPIASFSEADRVLKEIACSLWSERVFQIVLTPNYNDAHRNHFHVDLTEGSMYLGQGVGGVDPPVGHFGH